MKTAPTYYYWILATGVILPSATAWTCAGLSIISRPPSQYPWLRMSESDVVEAFSDYGRDFPRHHSYSRVVDQDTNDLKVDLTAVNSLINERVLARENKDFRGADNILNQLLVRHGVIINDSDNTWKTGTKREVKKRKKVALPKAKLIDNNGSNSRNGNEFQLSLDAGPNSSTLSDEEIVAMIGDRRRAQKDRDFNEADRIRHELKVAGVYVEDGLKEYRADGIPFQTVRGNIRGHASTLPTSLAQSEYSLDFDNDADAETVKDLVASRTRFKSSGNYGKADYIRDRLFETYNIRIDDRLGEWSIGGIFGDEDSSHWSRSGRDQSRGYGKSATSEELPSAADEKYVQAKVDERMRAKQTHNYDLADSIRDDLFSRFDVTIHDKINEWSVGGDFGDESWTHNARSDKMDFAESDDGFNTRSKSFDSDRDYQWQEDIRPQKEIPTSLPKEYSYEELECFTVVQLKEKLRESGLTVSGTKAKLINRLLGKSEA